MLADVSTVRMSILGLLNERKLKSKSYFCDENVHVSVSDVSDEAVNRKRRSSSLREEGEATFVAQMTVFDKNR